MNGSPTTGATLLEPKFTCQVCEHRGADVSNRHGWERPDCWTENSKFPSLAIRKDAQDSARGRRLHRSTGKKESGKPHWQTAIRELMIAAERSGHDAGANRDAESVEPWETGADATAQGGEEISDREVAAFAGHSPKNASASSTECQR